MISVIDNELKLNRRIVDDLVNHIRRGNVADFLLLHDADARLVDPVVGSLSGQLLAIFLSRVFPALRQFDIEHDIDDISVCSSMFHVMLYPRGGNRNNGTHLEIGARLVTRSGIIVLHEIEYDIAQWARIMLPEERRGWRTNSRWRRRLGETARTRFLDCGS